MSNFCQRTFRHKIFYCSVQGQDHQESQLWFDFQLSCCFQYTDWRVQSPSSSGINCVVVLLETFKLLTMMSCFCARWIGLFPSPVLSTCSMYSCRYLCFASRKSGTCVRGPWIPSLLREIFEDFLYRPRSSGVATVWFVLLSIHVLTKTCDIVHPFAIFQE